MKAGVVGNDCGLTIRLVGVCREECYHHFLGGARFGDGSGRTVAPSLRLVCYGEGDFIFEECHLHRLCHNGAQVVDV